MEQARDFVLSKLNRSVGVRDTSATAAADYELPPDAVGEAIINAICHRDYHSNASVEVRLLADRLEICNPGALPGTLTLESLREDHASIPNNPLLAESLYLARYIEKAGSGTQAMIDLCRQAGLPEPHFEQRGGSFVVTLWRDWMTPDILDELDINDRQKKALLALKSGIRMTNAKYQELGDVSKPTASRDLETLVRLGLLQKKGTTGRGTYYILGGKGLRKGSKGS